MTSPAGMVKMWFVVKCRSPDQDIRKTANTLSQGEVLVNCSANAESIDGIAASCIAGVRLNINIAQKSSITAIVSKQAVINVQFTRRSINTMAIVTCKITTLKMDIA